jgi:GT2 family glycosyltransferase/CelD/BcsL family acetyltransferase involved in cellulose biosynthesis
MLDVVIVNFHSAPLIERTAALARGFGGENAGVVMVDNSPGDGAAEALRAADPEATILTNRVNRGYAAAVNQAVATCEAETVLLLNPDVQGISGRCSDVLEAFRDERVAAVVTRLLDAEGNVAPNCFRAPRPFDLVSEDMALTERFPRWERPRRYRMLDWDYRSPRRVDAATGACLFVRRAAFADVGPFDERFFVYYEETDWLVRAKRRGWCTMFVPTVEAVHASGGSSPGVRSRPSLLLLESQHRYARKHFGRATSAALRSGLVALDAARVAKHTVGGDRERRDAAAERIRVHATMRAPHPASADEARVDYVESLDAIPAEAWERLAARAGHVFATPEWLSTWWRWYGGGRPPLVGLVRQDSELAAIVPLQVWRRPGLSVLRFAGHGPSDQLGPVCPPLTDPRAASAVKSAIAAIPLRRFVLLAELVPRDDGFPGLVGGRSLYTDEAPFLRFDDESWDDFLRRRGANFRQQVRRFPRKLAEAGAVSFRLTSDRSTLDRDLDTLFSLHRRRWEGAETPFLRMAGFHREIAAQALERGWLRLWILEVGGRPVAALHGFRYAGVESAYQSGRDPAYARYPLGFILISHAIREAHADGIREYHLLRGGERYKGRFTNVDRVLETSALARGVDARLVLAAAEVARGRSLGLRGRVLDRS